MGKNVSCNAALNAQENTKRELICKIQNAQSILELAAKSPESFTEQELVIIREGRDNSFKKLAVIDKSSIMKMANKFIPSINDRFGEGYSDGIIQAAREGLFKAAKKFNLNESVSFYTFASDVMKNKIRDFLEENGLVTRAIKEILYGLSNETDDLFVDENAFEDEVDFRECIEQYFKKCKKVLSPRQFELLCMLKKCEYNKTKAANEMGMTKQAFGQAIARIAKILEKNGLGRDFFNK